MPVIKAGSAHRRYIEFGQAAWFRLFLAHITFAALPDEGIFRAQKSRP